MLGAKKSNFPIQTHCQLLVHIVMVENKQNIMQLQKKKQILVDYRC